MKRRWSRHQDVLAREIDGTVVILDMRTEAYHALDPVGSAMWSLLLSLGGGEAVLDALEEKFGAERERLEGDLDAFVATCLERGFLREGEEPVEDPPAPPSRPPVRRFLALRAWWSLFRTSRSLGKDGFSSTYRAFVGRPRRIPASDPAGTLRLALAAFAKAENFIHLKRAPDDCLPRSLALFRFLRSAGLPVEHHIGVRRFPFAAHAWVELEGRVLHDDPEVCRTYTSLTAPAGINPRQTLADTRVSGSV